MLLKGVILIFLIYFFKKFFKKFLIIDLKDYFLFGFLMYILIPLYFYQEKYLKENIVIYKFYHLNIITKEKIIIFILYVILLIIMIVLGLKLGVKKGNKKVLRNNIRSISNLLLKITFYFFVVVLIVLYIFNYKTIILGYDNFNVNFRSICISIFIILQTIMLYLLIKQNKMATKETIIYFLLFTILLFSGSRLNFISATISYLSYLLKFIKIKSKNILYLGIIGFIFFGWITLKRLNITEYKMIDIFKNNLYEFLYTGITQITFIAKNNNFKLFDIPFELLVDLRNFIPSFLRNETQNNYISNYFYESPLGAKNIIVSLIENFGVLGGAFFMFIFSYFLGRISRSKNLKFETWFYVIIGTIPFLFFREKLSLTIYKVYFQYSILILILLSLLDKIIKKIVKREE